MGLYNKYILPKLTHFMCGTNPVMKQRQKVVPHAEGKVLEVGIGSGLNFNYYNPDKVDVVLGLDPSEYMWKLVSEKAYSMAFPIDFIHAEASNIPLEDNEIDTILITYTMCSLKHIDRCMEEMKRVLSHSGKFIFCEHGIAPDKNVFKTQRMINPVWKALGGGCNLTRNIPNIIESTGLKIEELNTMYIPGYKPASFNYWGIARKV
jgi:ubiquinone/menaquinone biosynthesis C-methylase UbiE